MPGKSLRKFWFLIEVLPIVIPAALAAFGAVAVFFLVLGQFRSIYVWPLGLLAALLATVTVWKNYPRNIINNRARRICNLLLILGVLIWGSFNIFYTSQHVMVNRDPAIYTNASIWLTNHNNLTIPTPDVFGNSDQGFYSSGPAFKLAKNHPSSQVYVQGMHLLPALIGLASRSIGAAHSLHINVLFGMSALLAIYGFGRVLVLRSWWVVVATAVLAASMPFIYFSRDMFTEPLSATFVFGALSLLWLALKSNKLSLWFLTGLVAGAGTMTRIDGYLVVAEVLAFVVIFLSLSRNRERARVIKQTTALATGMALSSILGWLDVSELSPAYFANLHSEFRHELMAIILLLIGGAICVYAAWRTTLLRKLDRVTDSWRVELSILITLLTTLLLVSRPLWLKGHDLVSGIRDYSELTTQWVVWYIGGVMAVLGVLGIIIILSRILKRREPLLTAYLIVALGTSLVYLIQPSIYPDQIWASRRLVPVILPSIVLFGAITLDWLYNEYQEKAKYKYVIMGIASIALVLTPLIISKPLVKLRPYAELSVFNDICASLPEHSAVLWAGIARVTMVQPTRGLCGVPSQGYGKPAFSYGKEDVISSQENLSRAEESAASQGYVAVIGVFGSQLGALPKQDQNNLTVVSTYQIQLLENPTTRPPQLRETQHDVVLMGIIQPDGKVKPLH